MVHPNENFFFKICLFLHVARLRYRAFFLHHMNNQIPFFFFLSAYHIQAYRFFLLFLGMISLAANLTIANTRCDNILRFPFQHVFRLITASEGLKSWLSRTLLMLLACTPSIKPIVKHCSPSCTSSRRATFFLFFYMYFLVRAGKPQQFPFQDFQLCCSDSSPLFNYVWKVSMLVVAGQFKSFKIFGSQNQLLAPFHKCSKFSIQDVFQFVFNSIWARN